MSALRTAMAATIMGSVSGCAAFTPRDVANPTKLTVEEAMKSVGQGFVNLRNTLGETKVGLFACSVDVNLNVTANAEMGGKLVLDASLSPPTNVNVGPPSSVGVHAEQANTSTGSRGNTIAIKMINPACLSNDTMGGSKPENVSKLFKEFDDAGVTTFEN